ncbi:hypothetical protein NMK71_04675 [Weeksellaceae bacterium KMM 9713]|uniref:Uncharacterized protein n=1 Tax=Profundicola chukchiensis TaxID=2961959 RepID=A0A9X4N2N0_9FLAO|nr:hypothetical protein [Profundicola chukchiensis]MDG4945699.1 hypothetical protein [Profundicola chukchiensis]
MKDIIDTTHLEFDKSNFLIDLVKHDSGHLYVQIVQVIREANNEKSTIRINPKHIPELIKVLQNYYAKISTFEDVEKITLSYIDQEKIQERYLKGVPLKDLALQFDQSVELIEMVLRNRDIEIVDNKLPRPKIRTRKRRKY